MEVESRLCAVRLNHDSLEIAVDSVELRSQTECVEDISHGDGSSCEIARTTMPRGSKLNPY